jgi:AcrR family transcriptional regulator
MSNNVSSFADQILDWERLMRAYDDHAVLMQPAQNIREALAQTFAELRGLKVIQESAAAQRQQATQDILEKVRVGREQARRLRGMAKGLLGTQSEGLVQFQVAPLRSRPRSRPPEPPPHIEAVQPPVSE